jgi:hypothetical protein|tara:strand:+ start:4227 stop:4496 length:270 start_codon:yes stop_codon:yes gene_type:complete
MSTSFLKNRRESASNEQCKVHLGYSPQAIYNLQYAESLLIPNQQSANLLKLEHTGILRFSIPLSMQYPFCKKMQNVLPVAHPHLTFTSG